jgi:small subunit ribosomal protein S2
VLLISAAPAGDENSGGKTQRSNMSTVISMKALLESGVHFGHRTNKWHPAMKSYIFTERNGIHIIDLQQTVKALTNAYNLVRDTAAAGGTVLFVGTKRQAQETVKEEAIRSGSPYVIERWLGGMLTNWSTMLQRIHELERLEKMRETGDINRLTKKEGLLISRRITRLETFLSGMRKMTRLPELAFIVDVSREATAVHEANLRNIPIIALVDTNCDPSNIDYVIPSNDDAIRAIKLLVGKMADAVLEGKAMRKEDETAELAAAAITAETGVEHKDEGGLEVEVEDEALLGEATLAKLAKTKASVAIEVIAVEPKEEVKEEEPKVQEEVKAEEPKVQEEVKAEEPKVKKEVKAEEPKVKKEVKAKEPKVKEEVKAKEPKVKKEVKAKEPKVKKEVKAKEPKVKEEKPKTKRAPKEKKVESKEEKAE